MRGSKRREPLLHYFTPRFTARVAGAVAPGAALGEPRTEGTPSGGGKILVRGSGGETTEGGYSIAANKKTPWT